MERKPIAAVVAALIALAASHATVTVTAAGAAPAAPTVADTIAVGAQPWGVAFSPDGSTAYVGNSGGNTISVIDVATREVTTITGSSGPAGVAVTPDGSKVFVTAFGAAITMLIADHEGVLTVTAADLAVAASGSGCVNPLAITVRDDGTAAYVGCSDGRITAVPTVPPEDRVLYNAGNEVADIAYVPAGTMGHDDIAFIENRFHGTPGGFFRLLNANPAYWAQLPGVGRSIAVDRDGARAYVGDATGILSVFDIAGKTLLHTINVGGDLRGIALSQDGRLAYVTDNSGASLKVVDLVARTVIHNVAVGAGALRVALSPDERTLLVTNNNASSVSLISIPAPPVPSVSGSSLRVACGPEATSIGATVVCTVSGGDPGIDILWRAAYNPVFAEAGVTLDESGTGEFSFVVPAAAIGEVVTVELVDWLAPVSLGVVGGPVPASVPAGEGPVTVWSLVLVLLAGGLAVVRRSRDGSDALRRGW